MSAIAEAIGGATGRGAVKVGADGRQQRACAAVRVSELGQSVWSETTQREGILQRARADGYLMDDCDVYTDHARGHQITRKGYQAILEGVRSRRYAAVYVAALDRWGRDSIERQQRGKELDRLGVPLVSLTEGIDQPGLPRVIRAELSEEESRRNATRVTGNRRRAAREGQHCGMTPYGYERRYPEHRTGVRRPAGVLTPCEPEATEVRLLFTRYADGAQTWTLRDLVSDLNKRGVPSPEVARRTRSGKELNPLKRYEWYTSTVSDLLRNPVYVGDVRYDQRPTGHYLRADADSGFVVAGTHEPLVSRELFAAVQKRLGDAKAHVSVARRTPRAHLVAGLLRCADCGGLMVPTVEARGENNVLVGQVRCANRHEGRTQCTSASYSVRVASEALQREVSRLRGAPWTTDVETRLCGEHGDALASLDRQLAEAKAALKNFARSVMMRASMPTREEQEAFDALSREQSAEIARLEAQRTQIAGDADALPRLRALHDRLKQTQVRDLVSRLSAMGDKASVEMRDLLVLLVESATIVERVPETRSTWVRLVCVWTADVQTLLDAGALWLDEPPTAPTAPVADPRKAARNERQRRYRAHKAAC